jgi:hypothetical protein
VSPKTHAQAYLPPDKKLVFGVQTVAKADTFAKQKIVHPSQHAKDNPTRLFDAPISLRLAIFVSCRDNEYLFALSMG